MVKTHRLSRFTLYTLAEIRGTKEIILQAEDSGSKFDNGHKCYLCEVVSAVAYFSDKDEHSLVREICKLNNEKRRLEKRNARLTKQLEKLSGEYDAKVAL